MARNLPKINQYLRSNKDREFKWGDFDCCLMAADIAILAGHEDPAKDVRGKYTTPSGAKKVLLKHFNGEIENAFNHLPVIEPSFAQRGDLVLFETSNGKVMAVKWINGHYCIAPEGGLGIMVEVNNPIKSWRVE